MKEEAPAHLSLRAAIAYIALSLLVVSCPAAAFTYLYIQHQQSRIQDSHYQIVALVQESRGVDMLKCACLAEMLQLSVDKPVNLYKFDSEEACQRLIASSVIERAAIKKIKPGTLYIDYALRRPIAYVGDYSNTAIDSTGMMLPFKPFFTPKNMPTFFLGLLAKSEENPWGQRVETQQFRLALSLQTLLNEYGLLKRFSILCIDVSHSFDDSCGRREIVVALKEAVTLEHEGRKRRLWQRRWLRLTVENYPQQLANYLLLRDQFDFNQSDVEQAFSNTISKGAGLMVDLRLPQLAFIQFLRHGLNLGNSNSHRVTSQDVKIGKSSSRT